MDDFEALCQTIVRGIKTNQQAHHSHEQAVVQATNVQSANRKLAEEARLSTSSEASKTAEVVQDHLRDGQIIFGRTGIKEQDVPLVDDPRIPYVEHLPLAGEKGALVQETYPSDPPREVLTIAFNTSSRVLPALRDAERKLTQIRIKLERRRHIEQRYRTAIATLVLIGLAVILGTGGYFLIEDKLGRQRVADQRGLASAPITIYNSENVAELRSFPPRLDAISGVAFHANGIWLASASLDGHILLSNLAVGSLDKAIVSSPITTILFSKNENLLISGGQDGVVRTWNIVTRSEAAEVSLADRPIAALAESPDGRFMAAGSEDGVVGVWDNRTGAGFLRAEIQSVTGLAFNNDGRIVAAASRDGHIKMWYLGVGDFAFSFPEIAGGVNCIAFSPATSVLAAGGRDGAIYLLDSVSGITRSVLGGHYNQVTSVAFSPDGQLLVSGSLDGTIRLWDVNSGAQAKVIDMHSEEVKSVAFSNDGRLIASGGVNGDLFLWGIS